MQDWEVYSERHRQFYCDSMPEILPELIEKESWNTLLDLGCGDGSLLFSLRSKGYLRGKSVYAVDISSGRVEKARAIDPDFKCYVDDATHLLNIKSSSIDILVSMQVIEHVNDDKAMIREISRVLTKYGVAFITTVFKKRGSWYFYRSKSGWAIDPTHVREYTDDGELLDLLRGCGLEVTVSRKMQITRPLVGSTLLSLVNANRDALLRSRFLRFLMGIRIPIPGYFIWEIVCRKNSKAKLQDGRVEEAGRLIRHGLLEPNWQIG